MHFVFYFFSGLQTEAVSVRRIFIYVEYTFILYNFLISVILLRYFINIFSLHCMILFHFLTDCKTALAACKVFKLIFNWYFHIVFFGSGCLGSMLLSFVHVNMHNALVYCEYYKISETFCNRTVINRTGNWIVLLSWNLHMYLL